MKLSELQAERITLLARLQDIDNKLVSKVGDTITLSGVVLDVDATDSTYRVRLSSGNCCWAAFEDVKRETE